MPSLPHVMIFVTIVTIVLFCLQFVRKAAAHQKGKNASLLCWLLLTGSMCATPLIFFCLLLKQPHSTLIGLAYTLSPNCFICTFHQVFKGQRTLLKTRLNVSPDDAFGIAASKFFNRLPLNVSPAPSQSTHKSFLRTQLFSWCDTLYELFFYVSSCIAEHC